MPEARDPYRCPHAPHCSAATGCHAGAVEPHRILGPVEERDGRWWTTTWNDPGPGGRNHASTEPVPLSAPPRWAAPWSPRWEAFPADAVRDLVAIARALYAADRGAGAGPERLELVAAVGRDLRNALELGLTERGSRTHADGWELAERAAGALGDLVGEARAADLVAAAGERVRRRG